jgi:predicted ATPase/DNA-binding CsgD family transcriptional regulator
VDRSDPSDRDGAGPSAEGGPRGSVARLPAEATSLVGRDRELTEIRLVLDQTRLLTLAGPGGCGKTRLALRVAAESAAADPDGVWWVDLGPLDDPDLVPQRLARALGVPESPGRAVTPAVIEHLAGRRGLLVLDNCEHLVDACAALADSLLRALPEVRLLATSREPLGVAGEVSWPVPPLAVPADGSAGDLVRCPSVALFLERARAARPTFAASPDDLAVVAALCRALDGIPLAIELAAARVRVLSPATLLSRLGEDLGVLADRGRTATARHRTLLATMDWSHDLLTPDERRLFGALSAFAGGFDLAAAEAVGAAVGVAAVLDALSGLVEKSLVQVDGSRFQMLETVRRYAADRAGASDTARVARAAHAEHVERLARLAEPGLLGPEQQAWVVRLGADHANIAAALGFLHERGEVARGLDLAGRLGRYWWFAGQFAEGAAWLEAFLGRPGALARGPQRARALHALGLATFWHETPAAGVEASRRRFEEAADICRELGDDRALAAVLRDLGGYWKGGSDPGEARAVLAESVAIAERIGDRSAVAAATVYLGIVAVYQADAAAARALLERAAVGLRECGTDERVRCLYFQACLDCDTGDVARARARFGELISADILVAMPYSAGFALDGLARLAVVEGHPRRALRLAGAARAAHRRLGTSAGPAYDDYVRRGLEPAWRAVGVTVGEKAYQNGLAVPLFDAVAEGLRPAWSHVDGEELGGLSAREAEVLSLVAEGLADAEVAGRLHLSPRTVGNHLSSAYRKLGVGSRTAAIRQARDLGLF